MTSSKKKEKDLKEKTARIAIRSNGPQKQVKDS